MDMTKHAKVRQQQRGIPPLIVDLLLDFGAEQRVRDGAVARYFDKSSRKRIKAYAGHLAGMLERHMNCYVVVGDDGKLITVAHRLDRLKH